MDYWRGKVNKIKILLIDDKPESVMENKFLPSLNFGFSDETFPKETITSNFELGWLQSPRDVQEFRTYSEEVIQELGLASLLSEGFIPEIILFDYKLSEGQDDFLDHDLEEYKLIIPTYKLAKKLGKKTHRFFEWNNFDTDKINEIKANLVEELEEVFTSESEDIQFDEIKIALKKKEYDKIKENEPAIFFESNDDMGCFSGGLITYQFRDHPCVGIPITSKSGEVQVSKHALFFEWLLSKDFNDQFGKKYGKRPFWDEIIPQAVELLRDRIELLVKLGKITPSYEQLLRLSNTDSINGFFSFISVYGERHLPLEGLFVGVPEETKIEKIKEWANALVGNLPKNNADVDRAKSISKTLWNAYTGHFEERILLSDYTLRIGTLNKAEEDTFNDVKAEYCNGTNRITEKNEVSIDTLFNNKDKIPTKRLAVLLTVARAWIQLEKCKKYALPKKEYAQIEKEEYIYILFPMVNTKDDLLLPMHKDKGKDFDSFDKTLFRNLSLPESRITAGTWYLFHEWMLPGEKKLLNSIYYSEKEFLPSWLREF